MSEDQVAVLQTQRDNLTAEIAAQVTKDVFGQLKCIIQADVFNRKRLEELQAQAGTKWPALCLVNSFMRRVQVTGRGVADPPGLTTKRSCTVTGGCRPYAGLTRHRFSHKMLRKTLHSIRPGACYTWIALTLTQSDCNCTNVPR